MSTVGPEDIAPATLQGVAALTRTLSEDGSLTDPVCAYLFGSRANGTWREGSDIDVCYVVAQSGIWRRRCLSIADDLFDVTIYSIDRLGDVARHCVMTANPHALLAISSGVPVLDPYGKAHHFRALFREAFDEGPAKSPQDVFALRVQLSACLADIRSPKSEAFLHSAVLATTAPLLRLKFRSSNLWCYTGPLALPRLEEAFPAFSQRFASAVAAAIDSRPEMFIDLIEQELDLAGGRAWDGYRSDR